MSNFELLTPEERLRRRFDAVAIPEPIMTGELDADPHFREARETFIYEIASALHIPLNKRPYLLNVDEGMIVPLDGRLEYTDEFITRVQLVGRQTLASIERTRTDTNYMVVQFTKHLLNDRSVSHILQHSDDIDER